MNQQIRLRVLPALVPNDGKAVEFRASETHLQYRYEGDGDDAWIDIVALADLTGPAVEFQLNGDMIQYRPDVEGEDWIDLASIADITAPVADAVQESAESADEARTYRDQAAEYASGAAAQANVPIVTSFNAIPDLTFPDARTSMICLGYYAENDCEPFVLVRSDTEPTYGGIQDAAGVWWKHSEMGHHDARQWGCKGDWDDDSLSGTDDTAKADAYISWVASLGGGIAFFPRGKYQFTAAVGPSGVFHNTLVQGEGPGTTEFIHQRNGVLLAWLGSEEAQVAVTATASSGTYEVELADVSGFAAGDDAYIEDPDLIPLDHADGDSAICIQGHPIRIKEVDAANSKLILYGALELDFGLNAKVMKLNLCYNTGLKDLTVRRPGPPSESAPTERGAQFLYTKHLILHNVEFIGMYADAVRLQYAIYPSIIAPRPRDLGVSNGYGINVGEGCYGGTIDLGPAESSRHVVTTSAGPGNPEARHFVIKGGNLGESWGAAADTHPSGAHFTYLHPHIRAPLDNPVGKVGIQVRGRFIKLVEPTVVMQGGIGIYFAGCEDCELVGGTFEGCEQPLYFRSAIRTVVRGKPHLINTTGKLVTVVKDSGLAAMPGLYIDGLRVTGDDDTGLDIQHWSTDYYIGKIERLTGMTHAEVYGGVKIDAGTSSKVKFENFSRPLIQSATLEPLVSGQLHLVGLEIPAGELISRVFFLGAGASAGQTNQWLSFWDKDRNLLGTTADEGAAATSGLRGRALSAGHYTQYTGLYYVGLVAVVSSGNTQPVRGRNGLSAALSIAPILNGGSTTGLTNPASAPATAAAITATGTIPWVGVG